MDKDLLYVCTQWSISPQKERNDAICSDMDGPRDGHTQCSKPGRERQICEIAYMWNVKNDTSELLYKTEIESQR